jgi:hypothetical protein
MKRKRPRVRRETGGTGVGDRKSFTITDNDARGSGGGRGNREVKHITSLGVQENLYKYVYLNTLVALHYSRL